MSWWKWSVCLILVVGTQGQTEGDADACVIPQPLVHGAYRPHPGKCKGDSGAACRLVPGTAVPRDWPLLYSCHEGYQQSTDYGVSLCRPGGVWTPALPSCHQKCGVSKINGKAQSGGGFRESLAGYFPWQAVLYKQEGGRWTPHCQGVLVSPRTVLTIANCVTSRAEGQTPPPVAADSLRVALGSVFRDWDYQRPTEVRVGVKAVHPHPLFRGPLLNNANDLAVLALSQEVPLSDYVMPVCVNYTQVMVDQIFSGERKTNYISGLRQSDNLNGSVEYFTETPIFTFDECLKIKEGNALRLTTDKYCADTTIVRSSRGVAATAVVGGRHYLVGVANTVVVYRPFEQELHRRGLVKLSNVSQFLPWFTSYL